MAPFRVDEQTYEMKRPYVERGPLSDPPRPGELARGLIVPCAVQRFLVSRARVKPIKRT